MIRRNLFLCLLFGCSAFAAEQSLSYTIVGTGQTECYDNRNEITPPKPGQPFYGQDAQHSWPKPSYKDNGDGSISDINTGLMWVQARGEKVTWAAATAGAATCRVGGHADWRMPTIKELYSLINFDGGFDFHLGAARSKAYLDTKYFRFVYGDEAQGERPIDCQDWSATQYVSTTMNGNPTVFGVNFADGRIKGYPKVHHGPGSNAEHKLFVRYVRGNPDYGKNDFHDNDDGTVTDRATSLMWSKADSQTGMDWQAALAWVQKKNSEKYLGHDDWRLPTAKELQSLVDYTRAPAVTHSSAIDPVFQTTQLGDGEYPFFWSSTTHLDGPRDQRGTAAVYVAFGRATGWMQFPPGVGPFSLLDVHGAGAQRSDPKTGDPALFPHGRGPQGDVIRINNFVRLVRGGPKKRDSMNFPLNRRQFLGLFGSACAWLLMPARAEDNPDEPKRDGKDRRRKRDGDDYVLPSELAAFGLLSLVLGRATDKSVTVSVLAKEALEGYLEYGGKSNDYGSKTIVNAFPAGKPVELILDSLQPNTEYFYRLQYRKPGETTFKARPECHFHTQRAASSTFTFGVQGDSHPERPQMSDPELYARTLLTAANGKPDFYICIGDDFSVDTLQTITADTVAERYTLQRPFLGLVAQSESWRSVLC